MTPAQASLKAYLIAKMGEGVFERLTGPSAIFRKASAEFAADLPVVVSSLLELVGDSTAKMIGQVVLQKVGAVARDVSARGASTVFNEIRETLDMQYQRGFPGL